MVRMSSLIVVELEPTELLQSRGFEILPAHDIACLPNWPGVRVALVNQPPPPMRRSDLRPTR
jgi:hypothetical protein